MKKIIYLSIICIVLNLIACGQSQENKEPISKNISVQTKNKDSNDSVKFQMPENGYYSNEYDEVLKIKKDGDEKYNIIEYSITHLLYVENAVGIYDSKTGILEFSGKDDRENDIKGKIINEGEYLEVTVTQSNYKDIIGTKQKFFQKTTK